MHTLIKPSANQDSVNNPDAINKQMDKQIVVHPHSEILLSIKEEQTTDTRKSLHGCQRYYAE